MNIVNVPSVTKEPKKSSIVKCKSPGCTLKSHQRQIDLELEAPHGYKDLGGPMMRRTTKIIREGKSKLTEDGEMVEPMHCQLVKYKKEFGEKKEDIHKQ